MGETAITILNLTLSLVGGALGAYVGLRIAIVRLEEKVNAVGARLDVHGQRLTRLEDVYFREQRGD
jgi:hypothetical protein